MRHSVATKLMRQKLLCPCRKPEDCSKETLYLKTFI